jgi:hypothetical protein
VRTGRPTSATRQTRASVKKDCLSRGNIQEVDVAGLPSSPYGVAFFGSELIEDVERYSGGTEGFDTTEPKARPPYLPMGPIQWLGSACSPYNSGQLAMVKSACLRERSPARDTSATQVHRSKSSDLWNERMSAFKRNPISTAGAHLRGVFWNTGVTITIQPSKPKHPRVDARGARYKRRRYRAK